MFDSTKPDYQDIDMPEVLYSKLVDLVFEMASIKLRDPLAIQSANAEQAQQIQAESKQ